VRDAAAVKTNKMNESKFENEILEFLIILLIQKAEVKRVSGLILEAYASFVAKTLF
jgi:hypothetical protein